MLNTININLKTDIKTDRPTSLPITLMSQDKNNNQFILRFTNGGESVTLDDSYTVEVLTKFTKSGTSRLTTAKVRQDYATWEFDTAYIAQDETVYNYVYVRKSGSLVVSADSNAFYFAVGLSEIDKDAGRVAETYDENYEKYLDEFKEVADFTFIQQAESDRQSAETTRISNENARKSSEVIRLASETGRVNAEAVRSNFYEGFDGRLDDLEYDKVFAENLMVNGDLADGSVGYTVLNATQQVTNREVTITPTARYGQVFKSVPVIEGNKYYVSVRIKATTPNTYISFATNDLKRHSGSGDYETISAIDVATHDSRHNLAVVSSDLTDWAPYVASKFFVIDLTLIFGAGKEPSIEKITSILAKFPDLFFIGTSSIVSDQWTLDELLKIDTRGISHNTNTSNPHNVTKNQVGLGNVNNTSDANKPISTTTQLALDLKLNKEQMGWITPTLLNGWTTMAQPVSYMKDQLGFVRLRGRVTGGTTNATIFNLPVGFRPVDTRYFGQASADVFAVGMVTSVGGVSKPVGGTNTYMSLDGMAFKAEV